MTGSGKTLSAENRDRNRISDEEIASLVEHNHPLILSISRENKGPIATPLWYEYRGGKFVMGIFPESAKGKLLAKRGRATITIQRPIEPYQFIMVEGTAHFVTDEELAARGETVTSVMRRIFGRYIDNDTADGYAAILMAVAPDYTIIEITPQSVRGESIPRHDTIMPKLEDAPAFIEAIKDGKSILEARASLDLYVKPGQES